MMDVLWATDCLAATVAWWSGIASALYAIMIVTLMIATAAPYHPRVRHVVPTRTRRRIQWILWTAPFALFPFWLFGLSRFGWSEVGCYARNLSLAMLLWLGPILLAIIFVAARRIGEAGAR
jgi:hypothetical protein